MRTPVVLSLLGALFLSACVVAAPDDDWDRVRAGAYLDLPTATVVVPSTSYGGVVVSRPGVVRRPPVVIERERPVWIYRDRPYYPPYARGVGRHRERDREFWRERRQEAVVEAYRKGRYDAGRDSRRYAHDWEDADTVVIQRPRAKRESGRPSRRESARGGTPCVFGMVHDDCRR